MGRDRAELSTEGALRCLGLRCNPVAQPAVNDSGVSGSVDGELLQGSHLEPPRMPLSPLGGSLCLLAAAGVSRSYLSQLEKGAFYASLKIVGRLAEALSVEPAELPARPGQEATSQSR